MTDDLLSPADDLRTLRAITTLKAEITAQISAGLTALQIVITQLTETHHRALLEQERRNATFAPQSRLEELIVQVHDHGNKIQAIDTKSFLMDKDLSTMKDQQHEQEQKGRDRSFGMLTTTAGWIFTIVLAMVMLGLGVLVNHLH